MLTNERLEEIGEACDKAFGEWNNATVSAALRAIPDLLDEVGRLRAELAASHARGIELRVALRQQATHGTSAGATCWCDVGEDEACMDEPWCVSARAVLPEFHAPHRTTPLADQMEGSE